jgi:glycosyltransferase involved in cell wall biosynthesis
MKTNQPQKGLKNIVFINQDSGYLMIDLINTHVEAGYDSTLITGRIIERGSPLHSSVKVEKIIRYNRNSVFNRLFTWLWATLQIVLIIKTKYRKSKLFIVSNPPFAPLITLLVKNPYSVLIFDIFPDALVDSGILSEKACFVKWWKKVNKKVFKEAERIFTITQSMRQVLQNYAGDREVELVPIWADNRFLKRIDPSDNPFIKRHNLQDKFIVLYSGNIGLAGQVDALLDIASEFRRKDIVFVFIGEGAKKKWLELKVAEHKLKNVLILPWQPAKDLAYSLSSANIAVVGIDQKASRLAMPSKLLSYLSVGAPILCLASEDTDLAKFVLKNKIGGTFNSTQKIDVIKFIEWLMASPEECSKISKNSLIASEFFTFTNAREFL